MGLMRSSEQQSCPRCSSHLVRKSRRRGIVERVACALLQCKSFHTGARSAITGTFAFGPHITITCNELHNLGGFESKAAGSQIPPRATGLGWATCSLLAGVAVEGCAGAAVL